MFKYLISMHIPDIFELRLEQLVFLWIIRNDHHPKLATLDTFTYGK